MGKVLVSEAFERYRQDRIIFGNQSHKTEEQHVYTLKSLLRFTEHDPELQDLSFTVIREWKLSLERRGLVSGTIRGYIINLRVVLAYMQRIGVECVEPELIIIPKRVDRAPNFIGPKEVDLLIKTIKITKNCSKVIKARNKTIISLLYASGVRVNELCNLNRDDVHEDTFTILGKGKKTRLCFIDTRTRKLLNEYLHLRKDSEPALFLDNMAGGRLTSNAVQGLFRRLSKRAVLIKPVHPHTLRHSYATNLLKNGCHIYTLSRLMGHSSIATTQTYLHVVDNELAEAYQKYHSV